MTTDFISSGNESDQQLGFIATLPSDIVVEIFSNLSQQDCLTSMTVCRDWYTAIPEYSRSVWKDFMLNIGIAKDHRRRELCLGSHVKRVAIEPFEAERVSEQELRTLIHKLLDWGCTDIESVELFHCTTTYLDECLDLSKLVAPRLTSLKLINHAPMLNILHILYYFPNLTRFWYHHFNSNDDDRAIITRPLDIPVDYCSKISHLRLDVALVKAQKEYILRRCPNLKSFVDTCRSASIGANTKVNLDELSVWCPKISFIEMGSLLINEHHDPYTGDENRLHFFDGYGIDQIGPHLARNQYTLEHLLIRQVKLDDDWSQLLGSLHLQSLKSLAIKKVRFNADTLVALLNHCPDLARFELYSPRRLNLNSNVVQSIHPHQRLKLMDLSGVALEEGLSLLTLLGHFPVLEALILRRTTLPVGVPVYSESPSHLKRLDLPDVLWYFNSNLEHDEEAAVAYFLRYLTYNSKIEIIQLPHVSMIGRRSLLAIAMIPTLKDLEMQLDRALQEEELLEFIRLLRETVIASLTLGNVHSLSFAAYAALSELSNLKTFVTDDVGFGRPRTHVDGSGLQHLLRNSQSLVWMKFNNEIVIENNGKNITRNQLFAFIREQATEELDKSYKRLHAHWNIYTDMHSDSTVLRDITITRM